MIPWWIYAIGAALCASAFSISRKKILSKEHAMNFESTRAFSVVLLVLFLIPLVNFNIELKVLGLVYLISLIGTLGILFAAKAFRHEEISLVSPLSNIRPAFVAILAYFFLSEKLGIGQIIGIGILFISAYLLEADHHIYNLWDPLKNLFKSKYGPHYLLAILLFSVTVIFDKYIISTYLDIYTYFFFVWIFIAINFNIIHTILYGHKEVINCFKKWKYFPFLVAFFSVASNLLAFKALSLTYVSLVVPVLMLSTLFIVLLGGKFFHERYVVFRAIVTILMLIGALMVVLL